MTEAVPCGWRDPSGVKCPISCYAGHQLIMSSSPSKKADDSEEPKHESPSPTTSPPLPSSRTPTTSPPLPTSQTPTTSKDAEELQNLRRSPMEKQISQPAPHSAPPSGRRPPRETKLYNLDTSESFIVNQYKILETLGQGSFGMVKLVLNMEDNKHYAMKIFSKKRLLHKAGIFARLPRSRQTSSSATPLEKVYHEIAILKKLDHPNVVKLLEVIDASEQDFLYLVFELVEGGEIIEVPTTKPLPEKKSRTYFKYILLGLEYLHSQKIVHRDIKPSNLLVTADGIVKIADLGACDQFLPGQNDANVSSVGCTPGFIAPEAIDKLPTPLLGGKAVDIWALGVTLFSMVIGSLPWISNSVPNLFIKLKTEPLIFPESPVISKQLQTLLQKMLDKDPKSRATLDEIKIDPWVTNNGGNMLPAQKLLLSHKVEITSDDIKGCVIQQRSPTIASLCLVKAMLSKHSFQNPFLRTSSTLSDKRENTRRSLSAPDALGLTQVSTLASGPLPALTESEVDAANGKKSSTQQSEKTIPKEEDITNIKKSSTQSSEKIIPKEEDSQHNQ